jgi:glycosyltransferase involved in cell wall biosynthesis
MVCICIPTYNSSPTLSHTLDSLLVQTFAAFEILIVDNASTDDTVALAHEYARRDPRIKVLTHEENVGGEGNFSRCIDYAYGDYTCVFHSDDVYAPTMVEKQVAYLERHPAAGAVFSCAKYIDERGELIGDAPTPGEIRSADGDREYTFADIYPLVLRDMNFFVCPSAMVRTTIYKHYVVTWDGGRFASSADLWVWLRILERYTVGIQPESLISYRISTFQGGAQLRFLKTERADFFLVTDYYNSQPWVAKLLTPGDLRNLAFLETVDHYARAVNALIRGERTLARELTQGFLSPSLLQSAFNPQSPAMFGTHRLRYWGYFVIFWILSRIPGSCAFGPLLHRMRYGRSRG